VSVTKKKPYSIRVTASKYSGWQEGEIYRKIGGLYGLCIGADKMYRIKTVIQFPYWVPMDIRDKALDKLEKWGDFEVVSGAIRPGSRFWSRYAVKEEIIRLSSYDKEKQKAEKKEICQNTKTAVEELMKEIFEQIGGFEPEE